MLLLKQIIQNAKYNIANPISVRSDGKNAKNLMIKKVAIDIKIIVTKLENALNFTMNWLFKKLSKIVAWISTPGCLVAIVVFKTSSTARAFAPTKIILLSNSDGEIIGFLPDFNNLSEFIKSIAEYVLCE